MIAGAAQRAEENRQFRLEHCQESLAFLREHETEIETCKSKKKLKRLLDHVRCAYNYYYRYDPAFPAGDVLWVKAIGKRVKVRQLAREEFLWQRREARRDKPRKNRRLSEAAKARWDNPEYRKHYIEARARPEYRKRMSETAKARWNDPEYRNRMSQIMGDPQVKERRIQSFNASTNTPKYRKRKSDMAKVIWDNPELRKRHNEALKVAMASPEYRKKQSDGMKALWTDPEFRERMIKARHVRKKALAALKAAANQNPDQVTVGV